MTSPGTARLAPDRRAAVERLLTDLREVFGVRLRALVAYDLASDGDLHTLALVDRVTFDDLAGLVAAADGWQKLALAVPLIIGRDEFFRTLDVFPLEYRAIMADHVVIDGNDPFADAAIDDADVRRACELQAKSHLIHLRQAYLESGGDPRRVNRIVAASAPAFRALLANIAMLQRSAPGGSDLADTAEAQIGIRAELVREILASPNASSVADPTALLARYLDAAERIWDYVDGWSRR